MKKTLSDRRATQKGGRNLLNFLDSLSGESGPVDVRLSTGEDMEALESLRAAKAERKKVRSPWSS